MFYSQNCKQSLGLPPYRGFLSLQRVIMSGFRGFDLFELKCGNE